MDNLEVRCVMDNACSRIRWTVGQVLVRTRKSGRALPTAVERLENTVKDTYILIPARTQPKHA